MDKIPISGDYQHNAFNSPNRIQRFWHRWKIRIADYWLPFDDGMEIIDAGCGSGVISYHMATKGAHVTGIDASDVHVRFADKTYANNMSNLEFIRIDLDREHLTGRLADAIIMMEVLEHVDDLNIVLANIRRMLKQNGYFFGYGPE